MLSENNRRATDPGPATTSSVEPFKVSVESCAKLSWLLATGVSTEVSRTLSKEFPLEEEGFSLKPPKLDGWASRRAKDKGILKQVNHAEESLTKIQLKIMDVGYPMIAYHSQVKRLLE